MDTASSPPNQLSHERFRPPSHTDTHPHRRTDQQTDGRQHALVMADGAAGGQKYLVVMADGRTDELKDPQMETDGECEADGEQEGRRDAPDGDLVAAFAAALDQNEKLFVLVQKQKDIIRDLAQRLKTLKRKLSGNGKEGSFFFESMKDYEKK